MKNKIVDGIEIYINQYISRLGHNRDKIEVIDRARKRLAELKEQIVTENTIEKIKNIKRRSDGSFIFKKEAEVSISELELDEKK